MKKKSEQEIYIHPKLWLRISLVITTLVVICSISMYSLVLLTHTLVEEAHATSTASAIAYETFQMAQTLTALPTSTTTLTPTLTYTQTLTSTPTFTLTPTLTPGPGSFQISPLDGMKILYVQPGYFLMGSDKGEVGEKPSHQVWLDAFWIDQTEVTNRMYSLCIQDNKCPPPINNTSPGRSDYFGNPQFDDFPVMNITWYAANKYCVWAGRRLPSEAEWEKAARGTDGRIYPWGNEFIYADLNFGHSLGTTKVGSYPAGASPYGALDMIGNVWEWVADAYDTHYYTYSPLRNPQGPSGSSDNHIVRGGGIYTPMNYLTVYHRSNQSGDSEGAGFRCALSNNQ
jgi:eukaryotic-like serine/threonine-protein kinase